jgi:nucleoside-diphosphate-sugar epimerase
MKIAITGSRGMIGSYLCQYLTQIGHDVFEIHRDILDISDAVAVNNFFKSHTFDVVIHGALYGREQVRSNGIDMYTVNMQMFNNIYYNNHGYGQLINLGSGTEYDTSLDITNADEEDISKVNPLNNYDKVKNHISRICRNTKNFTTLRMFGVMSHTEASNRFFKHLYEADQFVIKNDRYFDFINLADLAPVVLAVINRQITDSQLNVVYPQKRKLSELAQTFCQINNLDYIKVIVDNPTGLNYTGNSKRLDSYNIPYTGIEAGMALYKK